MISRVVSAFRIPGQQWRRTGKLIALTLGLMNTAQAAPEVVVSIKPLQLIAAAITEGISSPQLLMDGGHDPHHATLRPSDRRKLQQAGLAMWVGPALELPLEEVMQQLELPVITAQDVPEVQLLQADGATDPHLWLDTRNARRIATALTGSLQQLDAANAERYSSNLADFNDALSITDNEIAALLNPWRSTAWTASHQAFDYFISQYELQHPLTLTDSSNNAPGIRRVMELREAIKAQNIQCLLTETSENPTELDALLQGTSLHIVGADVLGNDLPASASGYADLMLALAKALASCLAGAAR